MGNVFSAISGQIGKTFMIGALLPATIFVLVAQVFVAPMAPLELRALPIIRAIDTQWQIGLVVALSTIIAVLLYVLNNAILRLYEGYSWEDGVLGEWLKGRRRKELEAAREARGRLKDLLGRVSSDAHFSALSARYRQFTDTELREYPKPASVLPTRFGNVIRSFENYPQRQYRIAAVTLWHRFVPKLSKEHAGVIDDAKSSVDFLINLSCLSWIALLATLLLGVAFPIPFASGRLFFLWILRMTVFLASGFLLYRAAILLAGQWGDSVRAAFDLHRRAVLRDLGFEQAPEDLEAERSLWQTISEQLVFGEQVLGASTWVYRPALRVEPIASDLATARGVSIASNVRSVTIVVRNDGKNDVEDVIVTDDVGSGREYLWDTASVNGASVTPSGTNPLVFEAGQIAAGAEARITYQTTAPPAKS